jgi:hypothetical protein
MAFVRMTPRVKWGKDQKSLPFFYVQDERYDAVPWMAKSGIVQNLSSN